MPHLHCRKPARHSRQSGFTLIEMMISITIGLAILAGLVGVLATNSSNSKTNDRTSELMTNGRYALNSIKQELREAGFRGYTWAEPSNAQPVDGAGQRIGLLRRRSRCIREPVRQQYPPGCLGLEQCQSLCGDLHSCRTVPGGNGCAGGPAPGRDSHQCGAGG